MTDPEAPKRTDHTACMIAAVYVADWPKPPKGPYGRRRRPGGALSALPSRTPIPVVEIQEGLHTRFARLFFGVITLLVLYYSYLIIKPYLLDIFMALVLFFTAKPLYRGPHPPAAGL